MTSTSLPLSRQAQAVINHPDQRSAWAIVLVAHLTDPTRVLPALDEVAVAAPLVAGRLAGQGWQIVAPPSLAGVDDPLDPQLVSRHFDLAREAPLRVSRHDGAVTLVAHHAAFDGRALAAVLSLWLGGTGIEGLAAPSRAQPGPGPGSPPGRLASRLLRPATRLAPSVPPPRSEAFATQIVTGLRSPVTARLARAVWQVANEHLRHGATSPRIGISLGVGGPPAYENTASYRRIDVGGRNSRDQSADRVEVEIAAALARPDEPHELHRAPRLPHHFRFLIDRASDTFLVSNLGRLRLPGVSRLDFYPVARGRSAVAVGAAGVEGGTTSITLRARDLNQPDAETLLDDILARLSDEPR